ncbi:MAG TPA: protein kinase [Polyangiaceae bacterium]
MSPSGGGGGAGEDRFGIVGRVIAGAYHVERVVAEGGFGVVYRAQHGGFRAPIALKCLKVPQHLSGEHQARFLEQFRAEAEVMFRLSASTPNVVRPLHVDAMTAPTGAFVPFLVLEWLEGETLDAIIRGRRAQRKPALALAEIVRLLEPVAQALDRAHHFDGPHGKETIVHCDLKPENVFVAGVGGERVVKILDFGVAKVRNAATRAAGSTSTSLFTPAYGAPEQWNPASLGETGPWTDVWGLALTIVETLVGEPVIAGDHQKVMKQVLDRSRRPTPRTHGADVPDAVEAVLARALAVDPRERPRDAGVFWKALTHAVGEAEAMASSPFATAAIPDLVPVSRPRRALETVKDVGLAFDFDEAPQGPALDLDLPPDEPLHKRSLTPPNVSLAALAVEPAAPPASFVTPTAHAAAGTRASPPPRAAEATPTLAPASTPAHGSSAPPSTAQAPAGISLDPGSGRQQKADLSAPVVMPRPSVATAPPTLARQLAPGIALAAASVVLTLLDRIYASMSGEVFSLGPLRTTWIAALLLAGGVALVAIRLAALRQGER